MTPPTGIAPPYQRCIAIKEPVPEARLRFFLKKPPALDDDQVLKLIGFDPSWIEIVEG